MSDRMKRKANQGSSLKLLLYAIIVLLFRSSIIHTPPPSAPQLCPCPAQDLRPPLLVCFSPISE